MRREPDWERRDLGELVDVLDSRRVPISAKERASRSGNVPYYGATGQVGWIDDALFDEPLILLGEDGVQFFDHDKPKAYSITGRAWVNNHAHVLRARISLINQRFLLHYLNWFDYTGFANGTTRLKLTQSAMRRIPVALPQLGEQQRIVEILEDHLSRLDAAAGYLKSTWSRINSISVSTLIQHPLLTDVETRPLGELLERPLSNGRSVPSMIGGFPVLRLTALTDAGIDLSQRKDGAWTAEEAQPFLVEHGDFLVSRGNGTLKLVGRGGLVLQQPDPVAYPDTLIRVRVDEGLVYPEYLSHMWNSPIVRVQLESMARTTAGIYKVNQHHLRSVRFPVPTLDAQRRVSDDLLALRESSMNLRRGLQNCEARASSLRRSLMDAAFSGRLSGRATDNEIIKETVGV